ncbi:MAG: purine-binding chemotaxis protein CheW [Candidatus Tectomicrobia bacterium]|uniref:Purine-binding chemotaxis protein CheW n=1 Tax=Tectimicrobiota bacterium TaxID=2528274 RepID=A0A933LQ07_UNCTE|nr:purine-binding chemotaxis protein CheW [Candidatus Tectomicrobia bacterium]
MKDKERKKEKYIDWVEVYRRLEAAKEALEKGWSPGEAEKKRKLKARAKALALEPEKGQPGEQIEVVEFILSNERYGLESLYVREVYPLKEYTPVPCTPPFVLGIINVRGEIFSIIDIRKFFDLPEEGLGDLNRVILLSSGDMEFGVLVDAIAGVSKVPLAGLQPPPPTFTGLRREYLRGITLDRIAILDAGKMLSDKRIIVNEFA